LNSDPGEFKNLAKQSDHAATLSRARNLLHRVEALAGSQAMPEPRGH